MIQIGAIKRKHAEFLCRAKALRHAQFSEPVERAYSFDMIRGNQTGEDLRIWLRTEFQPFLYQNSIYTLTSDTPGAALMLRGAFQAVRALAGIDFSPAQDNAEVPDGGVALYVGGSRTIVSRLRQHLYRVRLGTYALNMNHWIPPEGAGHVIVRVCAILGPRNDALANDIEDALWQVNRPIFGRLGR